MDTKPDEESRGPSQALQAVLCFFLNWGGISHPLRGELFVVVVARSGMLAMYALLSLHWPEHVVHQFGTYL